MPSTFPTTGDAFPTTRTDATTSPTTHAADHNNINDAANKIEAEILNNVARKPLAADFADRVMVRQKTFLGRSTTATNLYDSAVVEIDARDTVGGHPQGGWPTGTAGLWILQNDDGTAALKVHVQDGIGGTVLYVSHPQGGFQIKNQINGAVNNWGLYTVDATGTMQIRQEWPAGVAAGVALIDSAEAARYKQGLILGDHFEQVRQIRLGNATYDPGSVADNDHSAPVSVTVTGAAVGDPAFAAFSSIAAAGWEVHATVTATNVVSVHIVNRTGGPVDLASGTVKATVVKWT